MLCIAVSVEKMGTEEVYWKFWDRLSGRVQHIAMALAQKSGEEPRRDDRTRLLRGMLHADTPWQKLDYEKCSIIHGRVCILDFVEKAGTNVDVFEA